MKKFAPIILILLAVAFSYAPAVQNGFVWDDTALVLRDPLIRSWRLIGEGFQHFLFIDATASDFFRPLQRLTYTLEYWAFKFRPAAYHVTNLLIHAAAAIALYFVAVELLKFTALDERRRRWAALAAAIIWAVHPAHTSAVAYISGRADSLAAAFGFLGIYLGLRALTTDRKQRMQLHAVAGISMLLASLSKESGLVFPTLLLLILLCRREWRGLRYAAAATAFVATLYVTLRAQADHIPAPELQPPVSLAVRPILVSRAVAEYAKVLVWPASLHMERTVATQPTGFSQSSITDASLRELQTIAGVVIGAAVLWWGWKEHRRNHAAFVCLVCACAAYLPISGIVSLNATVAEHWIYIPSAFLLVAAAAAIAPHVSSARIRSAALLATAMVTVSLGARTFVRCYDWKDQRTFLERTIASGGDSPRMLINLGALESSENHLDKAKTLLQSALRKAPDQPFALVNLATLEMKQNDLVGARALLERATKFEIVEPRAQELLAIIDNMEHGGVDLRRLRLASRTGPPDWDIERKYIRALIDTGAMQQAIAELRTTLQSQWYRAETWAVLSDLLVRTGYTSQAAEAFRMAQEYDVHLGRR